MLVDTRRNRKFTQKIYDLRSGTLDGGHGARRAAAAANELILSDQQFISDYE